MTETKDRNGVLFHVSIKDRKFTIIGDKGINEKVPEDFWNEIKNGVIKKFKKEKYVKGLSKGIRMTGKALKKYFPYEDDDVDELPDEITWGLFYSFFAFASKYQLICTNSLRCH